jgi:hypothetical protein
MVIRCHNHHPATLPSVKAVRVTDSLAGRVGFRANLDALEKKEDFLPLQKVEKYFLHGQSIMGV